jgi:hypothetical protein
MVAVGVVGKLEVARVGIDLDRLAWIEVKA